LSLGLTDSIFNHLSKALKIAKQQQFADLIGDAYLTLSKYYSVSSNQTDASHQLKLYISYSDSINTVKTIELQNIIINLSNLETDTKDNNYSNLWYWLLIAALLLGIIFLINKIINQKSIFDNQMYIITTELDAYKESSNDLDEIVKQKTTEKIAEIKNEISKNKNITTALNDSLNNLNNVNNLKDIFLSKISHEIRTPLSGILGFSEILEHELALLEDPSLYEFANSISQSGQSLVLLLNNILDISRLDSNNMVVDFKQHNTKELIQTIVDSHFPEASSKGIKLIYAHNDIPDIYTDNQLFAKIISLILNNAIKFTEKGFIKLSHFHDDVVDNIVVLIKDTGIGIDKVYIDQVFEPFRQESLGYSTSYQGAGLGLPLAKKMSLILNGDIKIESEKGSGTTITLSFPAFSANIENIDVVDKQESIIIHTQNKFPWDELSVLVVEDDNMNQILYRKLLKTSRYLEIAKDGKSALAIIEKQISNNNFQLVLMDINLPEPWDGISLMKEIRNKWPDYKKIPFIAQTAYAISGNRESMLEEGFDEYITKPIIKSALIETINKVIST
ncbi:MAG: ATP-binding protein, partial [Bacteroidota bacterium]